VQKTLLGLKTSLPEVAYFVLPTQTNVSIEATG